MIKIQEPLAIGKKTPVHYTSMYGYPKDRIPVFRQSDEAQSSPVGFIKEEIIRGKDGAEVSRMYYERNGWRDHGQPRFFDSPEALILAFGGTLARKVGLKKPRAKAAATTAAKTAVAPKKRSKAA